jgi:hypothetical protein
MLSLLLLDSITEEMYGHAVHIVVTKRANETADYIYKLHIEITAPGGEYLSHYNVRITGFFA